MTCRGLLGLCDRIASFSGDEFEVWVRGEALGDARPVVALDVSRSGIILTFANPRGTDSACRMKDLVGRLQALAATLDEKSDAETRCCAYCEEEDGSLQYYDFADERPISTIDDERIIFTLGPKI